MRTMAALLLSLLLSVWYALNTWPSRETATCTMGGGMDDYLGALIIGAPGALVALALLLRRRESAGRHRLLAIAGAAAPILLLAVVVPWFFSTTVAGHHVCGAEFDGYLEYASPWDRLFPLVHVVLVAALISV